MNLFSEKELTDYRDKMRKKFFEIHFGCDEAKFDREDDEYDFKINCLTDFFGIETGKKDVEGDD